MPADFHKDMDKYLTKKRRKRLFSDVKSKLMSKKAVFSYKATNKFGQLKGKLSSKVEKIKKKEPEKEITQEQIHELVEKKAIKREPRKEKETKEGGWEEIKIEKPIEIQEGITDLEEEKRKIQGDLARIREKEKSEKERLVRLSDGNEQRGKEESGEDKIKRLELEEEVKILKEKQRIEEERLADLKKARRKEQMEDLRSRVIDILFKKKPKTKKDMVEEVRKEIRAEAKIKEAERKRELGKPKEEVTKTRRVEEIKKTEEKKPKKSFFSRFIQIKTAEQIAKEEEENLKKEEEKALKDQSAINNMFQQQGKEPVTNMPAEEGVNLSTLFPEKETQKTQTSKDVIELDQDYKIKVVEN